MEGGWVLQKGAMKPHPPTPSRFTWLWPAPTPHLEERVPICAAELEQGIEGDTNDGGQSHQEADGHSPAWVLVVVVGDWPVLDHGEDENELQTVGEGSALEASPAPPLHLRPSILHPFIPPPSIPTLL